LYLINKDRRKLWREPVLRYFLFGFFFCFFWRYTSPDILPNTEAVPDHAFLTACSTGAQLPPGDVWMKGAKDNCYYILQYYAAGFIPRFAGTSVGEAYNYGFCFLVGIALAAIGLGVQNATRSVLAGWLAVLGVGIGGDGGTLAAPFMDIGFAPETWSSMRFIGSYATIHPFMSPFGIWFVNFLGQSPIEAPVEYYSFLIAWRDYHPSLCSLLFFSLGVLCIGTAERTVRQSPLDKVCVAMAIATPFFLLVSDPWVFPLQFCLVLAWLIYRRICGRKDDPKVLFLHAFVSMLLVFPFFTQMAHGNLNDVAHIGLTQKHAPFSNWLWVMLPGCLMWALALASSWRLAPLARFTAVFGLIVMVGTTIFFVQDLDTGTWEIFNTSLKWWPWVYAFLFVYGLLAVWNRPWLGRIAMGIVIVTVAGSLNFYRVYWNAGTIDHIGRLDGYAWFTSDLPQRATFDFLKTLPQGVVLESRPVDGTGPCITMAQFSGHYSVGGWPYHEYLWRGDVFENINHDRDAFYEGTLANAKSWLAGVSLGGVDYIVWLPRDNPRGPDNWNHINSLIADDYDWKQVGGDGPNPWGVWMRKKRG